MTQCLCACPTVAPFVILDALTHASELGQKYATQNYPSQGTPICRLYTAPAQNLRKVCEMRHQENTLGCFRTTQKIRICTVQVGLHNFKRKYSLVQGEADQFLPDAFSFLSLDDVSAQERGVAFQFAGEAERAL